MDTVLLVFLLIALISLPSILIIIGIHRLHKENGIVFFLVGVSLLAFGIPGNYIASDTLSFLVGAMILYLSYQFYHWLAHRKSRKYIDFLSNFLSYVEDPQLPSCAPFIKPKVTEAINASSSKNLRGDVAIPVVLYVFEISFSCLGSTDFRDIFYELDDRGKQMFQICLRCNSYLHDNKVISSPTYKDNEEAIKNMLHPLFHM